MPLYYRLLLEVLRIFPWALRDFRVPENCSWLLGRKCTCLQVLDDLLALGTLRRETRESHPRSPKVYSARYLEVAYIAGQVKDLLGDFYHSTDASTPSGL